MRKSDRTSTSEHVRLKFVLAGSLSHWDSLLVYWTIRATLKTQSTSLSLHQHITRTTTTTLQRGLAFNRKEKAGEEMGEKTERKQREEKAYMKSLRMQLLLTS